VVTARDPRRGGGGFGCLVALLILGVLFWAGVTLGKPWFRYQQFKDEMQTNARFGQSQSDSTILARLRAVADSLELPPSAKKIVIKRLEQPQGTTISTSWDVTVKLPLLKPKTFKFAPKVVEGG
jgi:hypothetical protein